LQSEKDGLFFHKKIIEGSLGFLKEEGVLALEVGLGQANKVVSLIPDHVDFKNVGIKKDLGGVDRMVMATKT